MTSESLLKIVREKLAESKKDTERRLAEIIARPSEIEAEMRCMWEMILEGS